MSGCVETTRGRTPGGCRVDWKIIIWRAFWSDGVLCQCQCSLFGRTWSWSLPSLKEKKILKANDCGQRRGHCPLDSGVMAAQLTVTNFSHLAAICFSAWYTTLKKKTRMWCCAVAAPFLRSDLPLIPVCPKDKLHKRLVSELICVLYILGNGTCSFPFVNYIWH